MKTIEGSVIPSEYKAKYLECLEEEIEVATQCYLFNLCKSIILGRNIDSQDDARNIAIEIQNAMSVCSLSYEELAIIQDCLTNLGRKYNLTEEFKENGLI